MVERFGSREICNVTFKALNNNQKVGNKQFKAGQPVFIIDTATTSSMEQASTTVYAQGGRGYNRLIAWEGEKTMTFNVTDALMSPMGLAVLTGAGLADDNDIKHIHVSMDVNMNNGTGSISHKELVNELGLPEKTGDANTPVYVCKDEKIVPYALELDANGSIKSWLPSVVLSSTETDSTVFANDILVKDTELKVAITGFTGVAKVDFYVLMKSEATHITVAPDDFGGYFYVEADTLYRNQNGKDMAATLTFPKVKVQSGFTLTMAPSGDPSTFDFVMDAFPAYTYFDNTKKVVCDITIVGGQDGDSTVAHQDSHLKN